MTKEEFLAMFAAMYRLGNRGDAPADAKPAGEEWTKPDMAGEACCRQLDRMSRHLVACGAVTQEEMEAVYAEL